MCVPIAQLAFTTAVPLILTVGAHKGGSIELALVALSTCVTVDGGGRFSLGLMGAPMLVRLVLMRLALVRLVPLLDILMVVDISGMLFLVGLSIGQLATGGHRTAVEQRFDL